MFVWPVEEINLLNILLETFSLSYDTEVQSVTFSSGQIEVTAIDGLVGIIFASGKLYLHIDSYHPGRATEGVTQ